MRTRIIAQALGLFAAATLAVPVMESDALACGGCFAPPPPPSENPTVVTDHRMILSVSKTQSTLYDQIRYTGDPGSFAWVLPISGNVEVGLSADVVFTSFDQQTSTVITPPPQNCPPPPTNCFGGSSSSGGTAGAKASPEDGVTVIKTEVVGPYETVQLKADSPGALNDWLAKNGFVIPADVEPVIGQYQSENFNFLALKLQPGKGVNDMRPVRVTTQGANVALPLRMVAAGTGPVVGITLWVVSDGRYEPQGGPNGFTSFVINADELTWDWAQSKSNYTELRAQKTQAGNGRVWEVETSTIVYRQQIESVVKQGTYNGRGPYPTTDEERAAQDYLPVTDPQTSTVTKTAAQVRDDDMNTLFSGIPTSTSRVTRFRADLKHDALRTDLVMQAAADQAVVPRVRQITKEIGQPQCPVYSGCQQTGTAPRDQVTSGSAGGSTFTCSTSPGPHTWLGVGMGFGALALAQAIRRAKRRGK